MYYACFRASVKVHTIADISSGHPIAPAAVHTSVDGVDILGLDDPTTGGGGVTCLCVRLLARGRGH